MKKISLVLLILVSVSAFSQEKNQIREAGKPGAEISSEELATLRSKQLALHLDLSKSQQDQVKDLMLKSSEERKALIAEYRKTRRENAENRDKNSRFERMNARLDLQLAYQNEMKDILSEKQYETWKETSAKRKSRSAHKFRHRAGRR